MSNDESRVVRPFATTLNEVDEGRAHTRVSDQFADLIAAVRETGRPGTLVLTVKVAPVTKGNADAFMVSAAAVVKAPKQDVPASIFFPTRDGNLSRNDARQPQLPLRAVAGDNPTPQEGTATA